ncbi:LPS assembly lipoprotein LptE [Rubritalea spongiae]|uniref:LPS assembly lipoprotein LptE n=1 Tax=Rubritalea spongiae TaxID=430797 RepID=A0ABW5E2B1_9BACT
MLLRSLLLSALTIVLTACTGYQLGDVKPSKLSGVHNVSVPLFKNKTQEQRLAPLVTNSIVDEITRDGSYTISSDTLADATLNGTIETVEYRERRSDRFDSLRASEMYMRLIVHWKLVDSQNTVLMSGNETGVSYFTVESNQQLSRDNAFPDAAKNAAEKIVQSISSGF